MSLRKCLGKVLVYLVLEIGALSGVPMRPDQIEQLMNISRSGVQRVVRNEEGDGNDRPSGQVDRSFP